MLAIVNRLFITIIFINRLFIVVFITYLDFQQLSVLKKTSHAGSLEQHDSLWWEENHEKVKRQQPPALLDAAQAAPPGLEGCTASPSVKNRWLLVICLEWKSLEPIFTFQVTCTHSAVLTLTSSSSLLNLSSSAFCLDDWALFSSPGSGSLSCILTCCGVFFFSVDWLLWAAAYCCCAVCQSNTYSSSLLSLSSMQKNWWFLGQTLFAF